MNGIGIEIIVDVNSVDVIAASDISKDGEDVFDGSRIPGIEPEEFIVADEEFRVCSGNVRVGGLCGTDESAAGVEPCVEFDSSLVSFLDPDSEGIPGRLRGGTLRAAQVVAPGFNSRGVKCIGCGANLQDDGIKFEFSGGVEELPDFVALSSRREVATGWPVDVIESGDPCSAEFTGRWGRCVGLGVCGRGYEAKRCEQQAESHGEVRVGGG